MEAPLASDKFFGLHRTWQDWLGIGLGLAIMLAPWVANETSNTLVIGNATLFGLAVLLLAELDSVRLRRWTEFGQLICGAWVAASPFVFGYSASGQLRVWHVVAGLLAAGLGALELSQSKDRVDHR